MDGETLFALTEQTASRLRALLETDPPGADRKRERAAPARLVLWVRTTSGTAGVATEWWTDSGAWEDLPDSNSLVVVGGTLQTGRVYLAVASGLTAGVPTFTVLGDANQLATSPITYAGGLVSTTDQFIKGPKVFRDFLTQRTSTTVGGFGSTPQGTAVVLNSYGDYGGGYAYVACHGAGADVGYAARLGATNAVNYLLFAPPSGFTPKAPGLFAPLVAGSPIYGTGDVLLSVGTSPTYPPGAGVAFTSKYGVLRGTDSPSPRWGLDATVSGFPLEFAGGLLVGTGSGFGGFAGWGA